MPRDNQRPIGASPKAIIAPCEVVHLPPAFIFAHDSRMQDWPGKIPCEYSLELGQHSRHGHILIIKATETSQRDSLLSLPETGSPFFTVSF